MQISTLLIIGFACNNLAVKGKGKARVPLPC